MTKAKLNNANTACSQAFPIFLMSGFQKHHNMKTMIHAHQRSLSHSITP